MNPQYRLNESRRSLAAILVTTVLAIFTALPSAPAQEQRLGDLDNDQRFTVIDMVRLINHINHTNSLSPQLAIYADLNQDRIINQADTALLADAILARYTPPTFSLTRLRESSPLNGETGVAVTRETILRFTHPLTNTASIGPNQLYATQGGQRLNTRIELSSDKLTVTLFYTNSAIPLPASARIRVTFDATQVRDFRGFAVDADGDGLPGGVALIDFATLSITPVAGTAVMGRVFASELVPTAGGGSPSPGGEGRGEGGPTNSISINRPLAGVAITVDGAEETLRTVTDNMGNFILSNNPAGRFFVHVDGRTAAGSHWPTGAYYPFVGKAWEAVAGKSDNNVGEIFQIILPLIQPGTLQPVSAVADTMCRWTNQTERTV